ncbi:hypothetical protein B0T26DRAFT_672873 [Lasiosphaeria miniovina]|uniref:Uncharacterized protein n=1 Tax=Lasiosphaeria miniovina TaxID=1954250 RepID=A0AA40EAH2_9PEZI|nr:uncharacterized protein B0T26DRAFT_672873 [Lasiosphaeria miniovina]KAK0728328.1 hypothetical protein B0T26DRAFT_672873 [Lasiosphaeria miniovina]
MLRLWKISRNHGPITSVLASSAASPAGRGANGSVEEEESSKIFWDLWQKAVDNLDDDKRSALKLNLDEHGQVQPCITNVIQDMVTGVESSFDEYRNGGLKIEDYDAKVLLSVRENEKGTLRFALRSKAIIDSGVKFDPTKY